MLTCRCTGVIRNKRNKIEFYLFVNKAGMEFELYPAEVKHSIKIGEMNVVNMKLTKTGRLQITD